MSFKFCVLASGSKANSIYVTSGTTSVLFDCGLSARQAEKRLRDATIDPATLGAIIVSHEHSDHVLGVGPLSARFDIPVIANERTFEAASHSMPIPMSRRLLFKPMVSFTVGDIEVTPYAVSHDASQPVAFRVNVGDRSLGILTDLGYVTDKIRGAFCNLDALVLESNHDEELLMQSPYPWEVKSRIKSDWGHLSNLQAAHFLEDLHRHDGLRLKLVVAAHLSEKSNTPALALECLERGWEMGPTSYRPRFVAALQGQHSEYFDVT